LMLLLLSLMALAVVAVLLWLCVGGPGTALGTLVEAAVASAARLHRRGLADQVLRVGRPPKGCADRRQSFWLPPQNGPVCGEDGEMAPRILGSTAVGVCGVLAKGAGRGAPPLAKSSAPLAKGSARVNGGGVGGTRLWLGGDTLGSAG
jgi:hypothetical protein